MKKEARLLLEKGIDSLTLAIDHFNRAWDCGRTTAVLMFLNHAFEMILKASILHRGGRIRERRAKQTIGFDACVRRALSDGSVQFLSQEQALQLQMINSLRDAAEHHLVHLSEQHLAIHVLSAMTLARDVVKSVFGIDVGRWFPHRAIAASTTPPLDLAAMFATETAEVVKLLRPGQRRGVEAMARLRGLAILEQAVTGERVQPSDGDLQRLANEMNKAADWTNVFPGVASLVTTATGIGPSIDLRITKKEGTPVHIVPEGTPGAAVLAVRRVNELDFYNLGLTGVAEKIGLTPPRTLAYIRHGSIQDDPDCFKEIKIGRQSHKRYSQKAIERLKEIIAGADDEIVWKTHGQSKRRAINN
jgi:hypothetical protein